MRSRAARLRLAAPVPGSVASACQHLRAVMHSAHPQVMQNLAKGARAHVMEARQKLRQGSLVWGALQPARTARVRRVMRRAAACRSHAARRTRPRSTSCSSTSATSWRSGASPRPDAPRSRGAQRLRMRRRAQTWGPWRPPRQSRHPVLMASRACVLRLLAGPADGAGVGKHHALRDLCACAGSISSGHAEHCNRLAVVRSGRAARPSPTLLCCAAITCRLQLKQLLALRNDLAKEPMPCHSHKRLQVRSC